MSPTPNVSLARAPITGANDLRTLLPEVARMFRVLQPAIESAAALVEEVCSVFRYFFPTILANAHVTLTFSPI